MNTAFLLTTTAETFFPKLGFERILARRCSGISPGIGRIPIGVPRRRGGVMRKR
jgi:hypothetical protein